MRKRKREKKRQRGKIILDNLEQLEITANKEVKQASDSVGKISLELFYCLSSTCPMVQRGGTCLGANVQVCGPTKAMTTCLLSYLFYSQIKQLNLYTLLVPCTFQ